MTLLQLLGLRHRRYGAPSLGGDIRARLSGWRAVSRSKPSPTGIHRVDAGRQAYLDNVPEKMAEAEFWTRYCRAQYYLKVRKGTGAQGKQALTQSGLRPGPARSWAQANIRQGVGVGWRKVLVVAPW